MEKDNLTQIKNLAFVDGQNLYMNTAKKEDNPWKVDLARFRIYLERKYNEMVTKLFLLQFYLFGCGFVRLRKKLFTIAGLWLGTFLLAFLASLENLKFRYEIVL